MRTVDGKIGGEGVVEVGLRPAAARGLWPELLMPFFRGKRERERSIRQSQGRGGLAQKL